MGNFSKFRHRTRREPEGYILRYTVATFLLVAQPHQLPAAHPSAPTLASAPPSSRAAFRERSGRRFLSIAATKLSIAAQQRV